MKKILFFTTVTASLFIIKDLVYSIYTLWHKNDLLIVAQKELLREKEEHDRLKLQLLEAKKPEFIEKEARNKLFMVKHGEKIVLMSQKKVEKVSEKEQKPILATWQQWIALFSPESLE